MNASNPRQARLLNDYRSMEELRNQSGGMLTFSVDRSYQHYTVTINGIETLVGTREESFTKNRTHVINIELTPEYPSKPPSVVFEKTIFHPNWWADGRLCYGGEWTINTSLKEYVIDVIRMMQYEIVNTSSPANVYANTWYKNKYKEINKLIRKVQFPLPISEGDNLDLYDHQEETDELEFN